MDNLCVGRVVLSVKNKFGGEPPVCLMPMEEFLSRLKFSPSSDCFLKVADLSGNSLRQLAIEYLTSALTRLNSSFSSNLIVERLAVVQLDSSNDGSNLDCTNANRKETTMGKYNSGENPLVDSLEPVDVKPDLSVNMSEVAPTGDENCDKKQINLDGLDLPSSKDGGNFCGVFLPYPLGVVKNMASTCRPTEPGNRGERLLVESMETQNGGMQGEQITSGHMPQPIGRLAGEKGKTVIICARTGCQSTAGDRLSASVQSDDPDQATVTEACTSTTTCSSRTAASAPTAPKQPRFVSVSDQDLQELLRSDENANTTRKTLYDVKLLKQFLSQDEIGESREIFDIPPAELCRLLCLYFAGVRKPTGENYEPSTLRAMLASFERYLKRKKYSRSIINDMEFYELRKTVKSKQKQLKQDGKGNQPLKADAATDDEIDRLWESGQFGAHSPQAMINTLWFYFTSHFGLRGDTRHRRLCWSDIQLQVDNNSDGREYLEFSDKQTKKRTGENSMETRAIKPKIWTDLNSPSRCVVSIYKAYQSRRPVGFSGPDDPFYIAANTTKEIPGPGDHWFRRQPIGKNKLSSLMKVMAKNANLPSNRRLTNSSARKRLAQKLV